MKNTKQDNLPQQNFKYLDILGMLFLTCLIISNIIAVKLIDIFGLVLPAGVIIFPLSYIIGDILTEVYGFKKARKIILLGFICNLIAVSFIWASQSLPSAAFWNDQDAFEKILGYTPRLVFASMIAYLFGEFSNAIVLAKMKIANKGKYLVARVIISTIIGEGIDSFLFIIIAFLGEIPIASLCMIALTQWLFKTFYEIIITPITVKVIKIVKKAENIDYYDKHTNFTLFSIF